MKRTLIHNATIVNEGRSVQGSVVIEGDRIAEVLTYGKKLSVPCDETIDATGCCLLPGVIDDHVHFRDPGLTHKADILTESRAAAAGGVTSIMDMPNTNPLTTTLSALEQKFDLLNANIGIQFLYPVSCWLWITSSIPNGYSVLKSSLNPVVRVLLMNLRIRKTVSMKRRWKRVAKWLSSNSTLPV